MGNASANIVTLTQAPEHREYMGRCLKVVLNHQSRAPHLRFHTCGTAQKNHSAPKNMNRRAIDLLFYHICEQNAFIVGMT